jgi:N-acetylmuramoyl-L-alanine amidase
MAIKRSVLTSGRPWRTTKADLFVSLHANASVRGSAAGAEVFYLSLEEYGDRALRVARGETGVARLGGAREIEVILWRWQARYIEESAVLAKAVERRCASAC